MAGAEASSTIARRASSVNEHTYAHYTVWSLGNKAETRGEDVDSDALQRRIGEVTAKLAAYARLPEDDAVRLKTTACMNAWYNLEEVMKMTLECLREGVVRPDASIRRAIKNSKSMLEEVSFRVKMHDLSMRCHEALFQMSFAKSDLKKYHSRTELHNAAMELEKLLKPVPGRFKAARKDLQRCKAALVDFELEWKNDLRERLSHRPLMIPDHFSRQCSNCDKSFSLLFPRHHCRACGRLFCGSCCVSLPCMPKLVYYTPQLVCMECLPLHANEEGSNAILETLIKSVFPDLKNVTVI